MVCILRDFNVIGFFFSLMHSTTLGKGREEQMKGIFFFFSIKLQLVSAVALFNTNNLAFFFFFNVVTFLNKKILHV